MPVTFGRCALTACTRQMSLWNSGFAPLWETYTTCFLVRQGNTTHWGKNFGRSMRDGILHVPFVCTLTSDVRPPHPQKMPAYRWQKRARM